MLLFCFTQKYSACFLSKILFRTATRKSCAKTSFYGSRLLHRRHLSQNKGLQSVYAQNDRFIPLCSNPSASDLAKLQKFLDMHPSIFVLTGAGLSTESGIPDYRSEGVGLYATSPNRPVQYVDFLKSSQIRQRYWARNYIGWPRFSSFQPNRCHYILSDWERKGRIHWLVTQNVDALHYKAGSQRVTELHGSTHRVLCLSCNYRITRHAFQTMIDEANRNWSLDIPTVMADRPDGDVDLDSDVIKEFVVPPCPSCGGILKPEVTFFGDNVPKTVVHEVLEKMFQADAVLVLGSSLEGAGNFRPGESKGGEESNGKLPHKAILQE
ncbi:NAD-dependent protein deacylase [Plakobranchus ocellatus]|uniref:NAD-dependent protein deacylase n=1 Tax=Plakobranchus ocellatus TaxID=259542 RepID=A0AAV4APV6_9GAST|nr:NAD-dependent protein deacylase [Plakobranchus ocellatus]